LNYLNVLLLNIASRCLLKNGLAFGLHTIDICLSAPLPENYFGKMVM